MIIPRHKECDCCGQSVGVNKRYYIIKSKNFLVGYVGSYRDNKTHHICEDCMYMICEAIKAKANSRGTEK